MPILTFIHNNTKTELFFSGTPTLRELLAENGITVLSPCGGTGKCGKCKARIVGDVSKPNKAEQLAGCRLACQVKLLGDASAELLENDNAFAEILTETSVKPQKNADWLYGAAVDIGTTTVALKLFNNLGVCVAEAADTNPQREISADVIGRIGEAVNGKGGLLKEQITECISRLMNYACRVGRVMPEQIGRTVITGNTAMLYLYCGISPISISRAPFNSETLFGHFADEKTYLAPCMNAFVGGDITCALLASGICESDKTALLIDIGTNGELALWKNGKLFVTSCAAGPAFEGGEISQGCGNILGAIDRVNVENGEPVAHTIGNIAPVGICGSGLIDAVNAYLMLGYIDKSGYAERELVLSANGGKVTLTQDDIRAFQLAKAAIRAGIDILLSRTETEYEEVQTLYIAGGFGNRMSAESATNVGLLPRELTNKAKFIGNAALGGACMLLFDDLNIKKAEQLACSAFHIDLAGADDFYTRFVGSIDFD